MDNLDAQKTDAVKLRLAEMNVKCTYGPKNGADVWQPVDHGIGRRYQQLLGTSDVEWTKGEEFGALIQRKEHMRCWSSGHTTRTKLPRNSGKNRNKQEHSRFLKKRFFELTALCLRTTTMSMQK